MYMYMYICVCVCVHHYHGNKQTLEVYKSHIHQLKANPSINAQNILQIDFNAWFNLLYHFLINVAY